MKGFKNYLKKEAAYSKSSYDVGMSLHKKIQAKYRTLHLSGNFHSFNLRDKIPGFKLEGGVDVDGLGATFIYQTDPNWYLYYTTSDFNLEYHSLYNKKTDDQIFADD